MALRTVTCFFLAEQELYEDYIREVKEVAECDLSVGLPFFFKTWGKHRSHIKVKPHGEFMKCDVCTTSHEFLYGPRGVRPNEHDPRRGEVLQKLREHHKASSD